MARLNMWKNAAVSGLFSNALLQLEFPPHIHQPKALEGKAENSVLGYVLKVDPDGKSIIFLPRWNSKKRVGGHTFQEASQLP